MTVSPRSNSAATTPRSISKTSPTKINLPINPDQSKLQQKERELKRLREEIERLKRAHSDKLKTLQDELAD